MATRGSPPDDAAIEDNQTVSHAAVARRDRIKIASQKNGAASESLRRQRQLAYEAKRSEDYQAGQTDRPVHEPSV
jgi:hypothetical protein